MDSLSDMPIYSINNYLVWLLTLTFLRINSQTSGCDEQVWQPLSAAHHQSACGNWNTWIGMTGEVIGREGGGEAAGGHDTSPCWMEFGIVASVNNNTAIVL